MKITNGSKIKRERERERRASVKKKYEKYSNYISPPSIDKRYRVI